MVAQSVSKGVRSLMRTLYNVGGTGETGEGEKDIQSPPAKRRRIGGYKVDEEIEEDDSEHLIAKAQNGSVVKRRISSRTRRSRNFTDHDGNEEDGREESVIDDRRGNEAKDNEIVLQKSNGGQRSRNNADHDGNADDETREDEYLTGELNEGHDVAISKKPKTIVRRSSRSRKAKDFADTGRFGQAKGEMSNKLVKDNSPYSLAWGNPPRRLSSRNRSKRNNADHMENENNESEEVNGVMINQSNISHGNEIEEGNEQSIGGQTSKRLNNRDHRKMHRAEDGSAEYPITLKKRSEPGFHDTDLTESIQNENRMSRDELNTAVSAKSKKSRPGIRKVENKSNGLNQDHGGAETNMAPSSSMKAASKAQKSRKRDSASSMAMRNLPSNCIKNDEDSPFISSKAVAQRTTHEPDFFGNAEAAGAVKKVLRDRLTCNRSTKLIGIDAEYQKVYRLIEQTVSAGEGNSVLLIGARGCGKSALICKALEEVSREHSEAFHIIKLNGFFLTDDRLALREIWRQLGQEMDVEDETSGKNYADTLSKLLALLSHSATETEDSDRATATQKSVIFIMEEFDQFTTHPRQTLLYNLFDVAQSRKAPIAVIGMTTRIEIAESMEKRVKSRFSHRYIHVPLARDYNTFKEVCRANLECTSENLSVQELIRLNSHETSTGKSKNGQKKAYNNFLEDWNNRVAVSLFLYKSPL